MSVDDVGVFGRPEAVLVEKIGRRLIESAFGQDGSLLTPGQPIWTTGHLAELQHDYVDRPDLGSGGLIEKLDEQLATTSSGAVQLFAELLILNVLPISNLGGQLKLQQVQAVLDRCDPPVEIPDDVKQALLEGHAFHGGPAYGGNKPNQVREVQPWYPQKDEPAFEDMLAKLRRTLVASRSTGVTAAQPDPHKYRDYELACAAAAA